MKDIDIKSILIWRGIKIKIHYKSNYFDSTMLVSWKSLEHQLIL